MIKGIGVEGSKTFGEVYFSFANKPFSFSIISNEVSIPGSGILGSEFFITIRAKIDYKSQTLCINNSEIPFYQGKDSNEGASIINLKVNEDIYKLPYLELEVWDQPKVRFLIDTGAEVSIIVNKDYIKSVDSSRSTKIKGIGPDSIKTLGKSEMNILGTLIDFHIVPNEIPILCDGILGSDYLTEAKACINYDNENLLG